MIYRDIVENSVLLLIDDYFEEKRRFPVKQNLTKFRIWLFEVTTRIYTQCRT